MQIFNRQMRFYGNRHVGIEKISIDGDRLIRLVDDFAGNKAQIEIDIEPDRLAWKGNRKITDAGEVAYRSPSNS